MQVGALVTLENIGHEIEATLKFSNISWTTDTTPLQSGHLSNQETKSSILQPPILLKGVVADLAVLNSNFQVGIQVLSW